MRTIAASLLVVSLIAAASPETPFSTLSRLASYLGEDDAAGAAGIFDSQMKGYGDLERNIVSLAAQADVTCAIDVVSEVEAGDIHKLDLDWFVNLTSKLDTGLRERRRERVQVEMRQIKGKWKISSLTPVSILDPVRIR
jgi:tRNA isopentenyl-2-thiomethyl-A-37 hydroxylase MiaE